MRRIDPELDLSINDTAGLGDGDYPLQIRCPARFDGLAIGLNMQVDDGSLDLDSVRRTAVDLLGSTAFTLTYDAGSKSALVLP